MYRQKDVTDKERKKERNEIKKFYFILSVTELENCTAGREKRQDMTFVRWNHEIIKTPF